MQTESKTWDDLRKFYKRESKQQHDLRAINGKWMHKLVKQLAEHPRFADLNTGLNGGTLVLNIPDTKQSIYAFCESPGQITIYVDHVGTTVETFYGRHTTVEIEEAVETLEQYLDRVTT